MSTYYPRAFVAKSKSHSFISFWNWVVCPIITLGNEIITMRLTVKILSNHLNIALRPKGLCMNRKRSVGGNSLWLSHKYWSYVFGSIYYLVHSIYQSPIDIRQVLIASGWKVLKKRLLCKKYMFSNNSTFKELN